MYRLGKFVPVSPSAVLKRAQMLGITPKARIGRTCLWTEAQARKLGAKGPRQC